MWTLPKFRMFLNINSISYSLRSIANQNGVRYSDHTSYFKKYSSSKCKQTVCLHYGLDFHFNFTIKWLMVRTTGRESLIKSHQKLTYVIPITRIHIYINSRTYNNYIYEQQFVCKERHLLHTVFHVLGQSTSKLLISFLV
jgi:hypothetical protein